MANSISRLKHAFTGKEFPGDKLKDRLRILPLKVAEQAIQAKANTLHGMLGKSISEVQEFTNGSGYYQNYEGGVIILTQLSPAKVFEIHGDIYKKWVEMGRENYGLPLTDETATPDTVGRYNHFTDGKSIYWYPGLGAHAIYGAIRNLWSSLAWERSELGYPTSDEMNAPDGTGRISYFQQKAIYWTAASGAIVIEDSKTWEGNIFFSDGTALGGNVKVTLNKNGDCTFSGHLHDSGYSPYSVTVIAVIMTSSGTGYSLVHKGHTDGTGSDLFGSPNRNHDWNETVNNPAVRDNWIQISSGSCTFKTSAQDIFASDLQDIITTIAKAAAQAAVVAIIALI
jgi:LGFP repeat-containing protein